MTQNGLDWALEASGLDDPDLRERLLALYFELSAYPEVPKMLATLKEDGFQTAILSNGEPKMLAGAVDSAGVGGFLDAVLSVEDVGVFKPHASVYQLVNDRFGVTSGRGAVRVVQRLGCGLRGGLWVLHASGSTARANRWTGCPGNRRGYLSI